MKARYQKARPRSGLRQCRDGRVRLVCNFISDSTRCLSLIEQADWCTVVRKDYITNANGYRSYLILDVVEPYER